MVVNMVREGQLATDMDLPTGQCIFRTHADTTQHAKHQEPRFMHESRTIGRYMGSLALQPLLIATHAQNTLQNPFVDHHTTHKQDQECNMLCLFIR